MLALLPLFVLAQTAARPATAPLPIQKPADLYQLDKIWTVHLTFSPEQWAAMEPKQNNDGFGPGMFLAPGILKAADTNHDGQLTQDEFHTLIQNWFTTWDKDKTGLTQDGLKDGLNDAIEMPAFGGPGGALQGGEGKRNGVAAMAGIEYVYVHAAVELNGKRFDDVGVRYKGNGTFMESQQELKRPLKVNLDKYKKDQNVAQVTTLNLHNSITDNSWMNDALSHRLFREAGVPAPRTAYAKVYVTVPGLHNKRYFGLYELVEEVGESFAKDNFGDASGAILKPVTPKLFEYLGDDWKKYNQTYDPKTKLTDDQKKRIIATCKFMTEADTATFNAHFGDYVDIDNFARYMAALVYISEIDGILGPGQNLYVYLHPKTGKFHFIPWDLDHSFGHFPGRTTQQIREQLSIQRPWQGKNTFLKRVFAVPAFQQAYKKYLRSFSTTLFQPQRFASQVDQLAPVLRSAIAAESPQKLSRFNQLVAGKTVADPNPMFGPGEPFKPIKAFVPIRTKSIVDQLAGRSKGMEPGELDIFGPPPGPDGKPQKVGPGTFLSMPLVMMMDKDHDQKLSAAEFVGTWDAWFQQWSNGAPSITAKALEKGLNTSLQPPQGPGGPPPGGFDPAAMIGPMAVRLTGAGENPSVAAFAAAWKRHATEWDKNHDSKLTGAELTEGIDAMKIAPFPIGGMLGPQLLKALQAKESVSVAAFAAAFATWGQQWDTDHNGTLSTPELGQGFAKTLPPPDFGPGGPPGFGG